MGDRAALEGAVIHDGDDEDLGGVGDTSYVSPGRTSGAEPQKLLSKGKCVRLRVFMHACRCACVGKFGMLSWLYMLRVTCMDSSRIYTVHKVGK